MYKCLITATNRIPTSNPTYWEIAWLRYTVAASALSAVTAAADAIPYFTSASVASTFPSTAYGRAISNLVDAAAARTYFNAQVSHVNLTSLSSVAAGANVLPYFTGSNTAAGTTLTAYARSLLDDIDAPAARTTLGLGTAAVRDYVIDPLDNTSTRVLLPSSGYLLGNSALDTATDNAWVGNRFKVWQANNAQAPTVNIAGGLDMGYADNRRFQLGITTAGSMHFQYTTDVNTPAWKTVWDSSNLVKTTSSTDTTAGRMMKVGDFGLGGQVVMTDNNLDNALVSGLFITTATPTPLPAGWAAARYSLLVVGGTSYATQQLTDTTNGRQASRSYNGTSWGAWTVNWNTSDLVKTASQLDTTVGSMLKVGDFGVGSSGSATPTITSFLGHTASGLYRSFTAQNGAAPPGAPSNPQGLSAAMQVLVSGASSVTFYLCIDALGNQYSGYWNGNAATFNGWVTTPAGGTSVPPGTVLAFAGGTVPTGYLLCNAAAINRTTYAGLFAAIGTTYGAGDGSTTFNLPELRGEFIRGLDNGRGVDSGRTLGSAQTDQMESHNHTFTGTAVAAHTHTGTTSSDAHTHTFSGTTVSAGAHTHPLPGASGTGAYNYVAFQDAVGGTLYTGSAGAHTHTFSGTTSSDSHNHTFTTAAGGGFTPAGTISSTGGTGNASENRPRNVAMQYIIKW